MGAEYDPQTPFGIFIHDMVQIGGLGSVGSLAEALGLQRNTVTRWMRETHEPSHKTKAAIATTFKLSPDECNRLGLPAGEAEALVVNDSSVTEQTRRLADNLIQRSLVGPPLSEHETDLLRDVLRIVPIANQATSTQ